MPCGVMRDVLNRYPALPLEFHFWWVPAEKWLYLFQHRAFWANLDPRSSSLSK